ncbi:MAG: sodium/proline symporter [Gammaproteobacteria bacterium]|nr:sodium/proline symporter [Gammaproteobacteria bacterium]
MLTSFIFFLLVFIIIGIYSCRYSTGTKSDYYLAGHNISPWLVGLSAVATNNSGYMFIGVIGYTYATGLPSIWLMAGWIAGDFLASLFVHKNLRIATTETKEVSYAGVLSRWAGNYRNLQLLMGLIALVFLLAYASAQLVAGSKALHALLNWPLWSGAVMGAILIALYCVAGGIRASIWTDAAQSVVMIVAMSLLMVIAIHDQGGMVQVWGKLNLIPDYMAWAPKDLAFPGLLGGIAFAVSWLFAGFSVIGQPHIMVRFMTLNDPDNFKIARIWYYLWFVVFYAMATAVGLLSRLYFGESAFDSELALPLMANQLLPGTLVGLILAGIFAATISTADSLVLSCSSAITHDLLPHRVEKPVLIKGATMLVIIVALIWALLNQQSVFNLVIMAWSGLASAFAPLLLLLVMGRPVSQSQAIATVSTGLIIALLWRYMGWHEWMYEGMPGILGALVMYRILNIRRI